MTPISQQKQHIFLAFLSRFNFLDETCVVREFSVSIVGAKFIPWYLKQYLLKHLIFKFHIQRMLYKILKIKEEKYDLVNSILSLFLYCL